MATNVVMCSRAPRPPAGAELVEPTLEDGDLLVRTPVSLTPQA